MGDSGECDICCMTFAEGGGRSKICIGQEHYCCRECHSKVLTTHDVYGVLNPRCHICRGDINRLPNAPRRALRCSVCRQTGHNRSACPDATPEMRVEWERVKRVARQRAQRRQTERDRLTQRQTVTRRVPHYPANHTGFSLPYVDTETQLVMCKSLMNVNVYRQSEDGGWTMDFSATERHIAYLTSVKLDSESSIEETRRRLEMPVPGSEDECLRGMDSSWGQDPARSFRAMLVRRRARNENRWFARWSPAYDDMMGAVSHLTIIQDGGGSITTHTPERAEAEVRESVITDIGAQLDYIIAQRVAGSISEQEANDLSIAVISE